MVIPHFSITKPALHFILSLLRNIDNTNLNMNAKLWEQKAKENSTFSFDSPFFITIVDSTTKCLLRNEGYARERERNNPHHQRGEKGVWGFRFHDSKNLGRKRETRRRPREKRENNRRGKERRERRISKWEKVKF